MSFHVWKKTVFHFKDENVQAFFIAPDRVTKNSEIMLANQFP
jgi:hypothetical protein